MMKELVILGGLTAFLLTLLAPAGKAQDGSLDGPFTAEQEQRIEEIVRAYLLKRPETLIEARQALEARQAEAAAAQFALALQQTREGLLHDPATPIGGNRDGVVSVVEFFDYNCAYCRRASPTVAEILKGNLDVRLVYKELPILGDSSKFAARAALAVHRQSPELYESFHKALMSAKDKLTEDAVVDLAREVGADVERMRSHMDDPAIQAHLDHNVELAKVLGINGTPAFVIGNAHVRGAQPLAVLRKAIEKARAIQ
jgi:protein-disulfide isomerase